MTKKVSEMTLAEFLKEAEKKDPEYILQDEHFGFLNVLKQEGFTEYEALDLNITKAWEFHINCARAQQTILGIRTLLKRNLSQKL